MLASPNAPDRLSLQPRRARQHRTHPRLAPAGPRLPSPRAPCRAPHPARRHPRRRPAGDTRQPRQKGRGTPHAGDPARPRPPAPGPAPQAPADPLADYPDRLEDALETLGFDVLPWPAATHAELAAAAVQRRPPFDAAGSGYRDALVWRSALDLAQAGRHVVLASSDNDFADRHGNLAPALADEAASTPGRIEIVRDLASWVVDKVPWQKDERRLTELAAAARDERFIHWAISSDLLEDLPLDAETLHLPVPVTDIDIHDTAWDGTWDTDTARALDDRHTVVTYTLSGLTADITFVAAADDLPALGIPQRPLEQLHNLVRTTVTLTMTVAVLYDAHDQMADATVIGLRASDTGTAGTLRH